MQNNGQLFDKAHHITSQGSQGLMLQPTVNKPSKWTTCVASESTDTSLYLCPEFA